PGVVGGAAVGRGADVRVGVGGVLLLPGGVVALLLAVAGVVVGVALGGGGVLVLVRLLGRGGVTAGVTVGAVGAGVVGHRLGLVDRSGLGRRGPVRAGGEHVVAAVVVVLAVGVVVTPVGGLVRVAVAGRLEVGDLQSRLVTVVAAALDGGQPGRVDRPALGEAAAEGQRDVGLADREGGGAQTDDDHGRDQHADHHTEEAHEGEQPPAQPRLVLQQHLAEQPQRDDAERDVEDRPAHVRPSPSGRYAVCRTPVRPV